MTYFLYSICLEGVTLTPYQGFSSHRKKSWNEEDDDRNSLIIAFSKIVEHILPDAIVMENVPEFLSERYLKYFSSAKENFRTVRDAIGNLPKVDAGVAAPNDPMHKSAAHKNGRIN